MIGGGFVQLMNTSSNITNKACYFYSKGNCLMRKSNCDGCKFFAVAASPVFLNQTANLLKNAQKIEKDAEYDDLVMHATALYFVSKNANDEEEYISAEEMAEITKMFYKGKVPNLRLISCNSGALEDGLAQQFANLLGVKIKAPVGPVVVFPDGEFYIQEPETGKHLVGEKGWVVFYPKED